MIGNKKCVRKKFQRAFAGLMAGICVFTSLYIAPAEKSYAKTEYGLEMYEEKLGFARTVSEMQAQIDALQKRES